MFKRKIIFKTTLFNYPLKIVEVKMSESTMNHHQNIINIVLLACKLLVT